MSVEGPQHTQNWNWLHIHNKCLNTCITHNAFRRILQLALPSNLQD
jgi:hypothetical protein